MFEREMIHRAIEYRTLTDLPPYYKRLRIQSLLKLSHVSWWIFT